MDKILILILLTAYVQICSGQCGGSYYLYPGQGLTYRSPGYPNAYGPGSDCSWRFSAPAGTIFDLVCNIDIFYDGSGYCDADHFFYIPEFDYLSCGSYTESKRIYSNIFEFIFYRPYSWTSYAWWNGDYIGFTCSLVATGSSSSCDCENQNKKRILGGQETAINEYPYQVRLAGYDGRHNCGGTIIHNRVILTAAHCVVGETRILVGLGEHDYSTSVETFTTYVDAMMPPLIHSQYNVGADNNNDIALLILSSPIVYSSRVQPICLPSFDPYSIDGQAVTAIGWGELEDGRYPPALREVDLIFLSEGSCQNLDGSLLYRVTENMVCVVGSAKGVCRGDSGGPIIYTTTAGTPTQVGVNSFSKNRLPNNKCDPNGIDVFTNLHNYIGWIQQVLLAIGLDRICVP